MSQTPEEEQLGTKLEFLYIEEKKNKTNQKKVSMLTFLWGSSCWDLCLIIALIFPEKNATLEDVNNFHDFICSLVRVLPCKGCIQHAVEYVKVNPPVGLDTRIKCVTYIVDFHNDVNKRLGKRLFTVKEATDALQLRLSPTFQTMVRAEQMRTEDSLKITELQRQLALVSGGANPQAVLSSTAETSPYVYVSIALGILVLIFIVVIIVLSRQNHKLNHKLKQQA